MATFTHKYTWLIGAFHFVAPLSLIPLLINERVSYGASSKLSRLFSCFIPRSIRLTKADCQPAAAMDAVQDPRERKSKCPEKLQ